MTDQILSEEKRAMFMELETLFNTAGWAYLRKGWEAERDRLYKAVFFGAESFDDVQHARIRYQLLGELVDLPLEMERNKDMAIEEAKERLSQEDG
jgi:hypothetical protein